MALSLQPLARRPSALSPVALAVVLSACGGSPTNPDPPPSAGPAITCPADVQVMAPGSSAQATVSYPAPVVTGGQAPVTTACTPPSGSTFPVGTTRVTCTATDALARSASCSFNVVVASVPTVAYTKYLAFGDSITLGITSPDPTLLFLNPPESYPFKLQALLAGRYANQTIDVVNEGKGGEPAIGEGVTRLPGALSTHRPEVLLLLHGANDLLAAGRTGTLDTTIPKIVGALETMVKTGKGRGAAVMLATFPPQDAAGSRGQGAPGVPPLNDQIRRLALDEGVVLVDLFAGLGGTPTGSIGVDGLHPTETGYSKIATVWFEAIRASYERSR